MLWLAACSGGSQAGGSASSGGASAGADPTRPERDQVTSVYGTTSGSSAAMWIAGEKGFFRKYGLNVNVQYAESNATTAALLAGEAQFGQGDAPTAFAAYASGA